MLASWEALLLAWRLIVMGWWVGVMMLMSGREGQRGRFGFLGSDLVISSFRGGLSFCDIASCGGLRAGGPGPLYPPARAPGACTREAKGISGLGLAGHLGHLGSLSAGTMSHF